MNLISRIIEKIINANRKVKVTYVIVLDTISSIFSTGLAFIVRLDLETLTAVSSNLLFPFILSFVLFLPIFYWCNIYNTIFRYFDVANIKSGGVSVIRYALPFFFII